MIMISNNKNLRHFLLFILASSAPIFSILCNNLSLLNGKIVLTSFIFFFLNIIILFLCKGFFEIFFNSFKSVSLSIATLFLLYFFSEIRDFAYSLQATNSLLDRKLTFISFYGLVYFLIIFLNSKIVYNFINIFTWMYFLLPIVVSSFQEKNTDSISQKMVSSYVDSPFQNIVFHEKLNVYIITVDGYGRQDKLKEYLNFSNDLIPFFKANGYNVIENSTSNYPLTFLSIASTLTGTYLFKEGQSYYSRTPLYNIIGGNNPVDRTFEENGYLVVHGEGGAHDVANCSNPKAHCIKKSFFETGSVPYQYIERKISSEMLGVILNKTPFYILNNAFTNHIIVTIDQIVKEVDSIREENPDKPIYMYAYTIPPHPPFIFNPDCSSKFIFKNKKNLGDSKDKAGYLDNIKCTNKNIMHFIDYINETDPTAIVVFFSDHGTDFTVDWMKDPQEWSKESVEERLSNMIAIKLPKKCSDLLPKDMSNINIFSYVFSCLSGKDIKKEDNHYFITIYENTPFEGKFVEKYLK